VYFGWGELLALDAQTAYGASDYPGDFDTWCGGSQLLAVSLGSVDPDYHDVLAERRTDYILEDLPVPTPAPGGVAYVSSSPCTGARAGHPAIILDKAHVVLASGPILGVFDRATERTPPPPITPFALYRDATFLGGPFAGRLYVARSHGLDALTIGNHHAPHFDPIIVGDAKTFAVAGLEDRLYASDGTTTTAFDARTFAKRTDYRIGCAHLTALVRTKRADVLECDGGGTVGFVVALPR
jgi:hypothetical protein